MSVYCVRYLGLLHILHEHRNTVLIGTLPRQLGIVGRWLAQLPFPPVTRHIPLLIMELFERANEFTPDLGKSSSSRDDHYHRLFTLASNMETYTAAISIQQ